jgi:hypothetical protein
VEAHQECSWVVLEGALVEAHQEVALVVSVVEEAVVADRAEAGS